MMLELTARWNRFDHPATMPAYGGSSFPSIWWSKDAKAGARP